MIYALIAVLLAGFGAGFGLEHTLAEAKVRRLESAIQRQKTEAQSVLKAVVEKVAQQQQHQLRANQELEDARTSSIHTINAYHDRLAAVRLRVPVARRGSPGPVSAGPDTAQLHHDDADAADFSAAFARYLTEESFRADRCAVDKNALLQFVRAGCGLDRAD
ncbi:MAG: hypothetical protein PHT88_04900 [Candidatus Moranbacteria bacterium]|nr:hypothetical protein [Candidatus Moranbacteria bacterium]